MNENEKIARDKAQECRDLLGQFHICADPILSTGKSVIETVIAEAITRATEGLQKENEQLVQLLRQRGIHVEECDFLLLSEPATKPPIAPAVAELVNACKLLKKNSWIHKCDDGVGGCRAVSQSVFDDFKKALAAMNESEAK